MKRKVILLGLALVLLTGRFQVSHRGGTQLLKNNGRIAQKSRFFRFSH